MLIGRRSPTTTTTTPRLSSHVVSCWFDTMLPLFGPFSAVCKMGRVLWGCKLGPGLHHVSATSHRHALYYAKIVGRQPLRTSARPPIAIQTWPGLHHVSTTSHPAPIRRRATCPPTTCLPACLTTCWRERRRPRTNSTADGDGGRNGCAM